MNAELERIRRVRSLLEPLAVLYEKAVKGARTESFEIRLNVTPSTDYASGVDPAVGTTHIMDGKSLRAVHEIWKHYQQTEREMMEQITSTEGDGEACDLTVQIPALNTSVLQKKQEQLVDSKRFPDGLNSYSAPERAWLEWFYSLSETDRNIVEIGGEKGISVTATNFDEMKKVVMG